MKERVWYQDGLKFKCTECGSCCTGAPGFVWVNKAEIEALAAAVKMDVAQFEATYVRQVGIRKSLIELPNGDCIFWNRKTRGCWVYEARPLQCRTWPFWESNVLSPAAWAAVCEACPGCERGKHFPREEIDALVAQRKV